jgi:hypothetical protein
MGAHLITEPYRKLVIWDTTASNQLAGLRREVRSSGLTVLLRLDAGVGPCARLHPLHGYAPWASRDAHPAGPREVSQPKSSVACEGSRL